MVFSTKHRARVLVPGIRSELHPYLAAQFGDFRWQGGYGAFSVSQSAVRSVIRYVQEQEEHHRAKTFQDEFVELLRLHDIAYDDRYVWD